VKLFSDACEYGLRATVWLSHRTKQSHKVSEIAEGTQSSPGYLIKVLQRLAKADILSAQRGRQGGFMLLRSPETLSVLEIINAIDPIERIRSCPLGLEGHAKQLCPLHKQIDDAMAQIEDGFGALTIATLVNDPARSQSLCGALNAPIVPTVEKGE